MINQTSKSMSGRVKWVSRLAKWWLVVCALFTLWLTGTQCVQFFRIGFPEEGPPIMVGVLAMASMLVTVIWYGFLGRLFHLYERGVFFIGENARCIKALGLIFLVWWVIGIPLTNYKNTTQTEMARAYHNQSVPPEQQIPEGTTMVQVKTRHVEQSLFGMDVGWGLNLHILGAGIVILLIAWIMEEGCRLREDQELTV